MNMKVVGYVRTSAHGRRRKISLREQERQIRCHARLRGMTLVHVYVEEPVGGSIDCPVLEQMMTDAHRGNGCFEKVLVQGFSRFSRDIGDFEKRRRELAQLGIRLDAVADPRA